MTLDHALEQTKFVYTVVTNKGVERFHKNTPVGT